MLDAAETVSKSLAQSDDWSKMCIRRKWHGQDALLWRKSTDAYQIVIVRVENEFSMKWHLSSGTFSVRGKLPDHNRNYWWITSPTDTQIIEARLLGII